MWYRVAFLCLFFLMMMMACHRTGSGNGKVSQTGLMGDPQDSIIQNTSHLQTGAQQTHLWFPKLQGKRVGVTGNHSSLIGEVHLVDSLMAAGIRVVKVYCPEHGFRGEAEAGARVSGGIDPMTGLPVISLYGKHKKPLPADLEGIDIMVFDIQDVGARFYTYISTMHYVMEACAEQRIPVLVLDRPNPHANYIDGPVLDPRFASFIGMHPVPLVHGMTIAEYARMIQGEGWLKGGVLCELSWVPMQGYTRNTVYPLPVNPSPNLQDMHAIYLYPSICLLEGTTASVGRGTDFPFRLIGHPKVTTGDTTFVPRSIPGKSEKPKFLGETCHGWKLTGQNPDGSSRLDSIDLTWLLRIYHQTGQGKAFFTSSFDLLAGTDALRNQILNNATEQEIRKSWQPALQTFTKTREKYLLY